MPELINDAIGAVFDATIQASEEAIINALFAAETLTGRDGNTVFELPEARALAFERTDYPLIRRPRSL